MIFQNVVLQAKQKGAWRRMLFLWYPKCTSCRKAKKFLDGRGADCTPRHIREEKL